MGAVNLKLDWATHEAARIACKRWHYSGTMPVGKTVKIGVWENGLFMGVVIFSAGSGMSCDGRKYGIAKTFEATELQRIALNKHATPVSRIISIAMRMLHKANPGIRLVVSFADPSEGHHGGIYQAVGWVFSGKSANAELRETIDGRWIHRRVFTSGWGKGAKGIDRNLLTGRQKMASGKYRYLFPLDDEIRTRIEPLRKPYPKRAGSAAGGTPSIQEGGDGSTPIPALSC